MSRGRSKRTTQSTRKHEQPPKQQEGREPHPRLKDQRQKAEKKKQPQRITNRKKNKSYLPNVLGEGDHRKTREHSKATEKPSNGMNSRRKRGGRRCWRSTRKNKKHKERRETKNRNQRRKKKTFAHLRRASRSRVPEKVVAVVGTTLGDEAGCSEPFTTSLRGNGARTRQKPTKRNENDGKKGKVDSQKSRTLGNAVAVAGTALGDEAGCPEPFATCTGGNGARKRQNPTKTSENDGKNNRFPITKHRKQTHTSKNRALNTRKQ